MTHQSKTESFLSSLNDRLQPSPVYLRFNQVDEGKVFAYFYIRTTSWELSGERTDLHDLLSMLLSLSLRTERAAFSSRLWDVPHPVTGIETELYARYITLIQPDGSLFNIADKERLQSLTDAAVAFLGRLPTAVDWTKGSIDVNEFSFEEAVPWAAQIARAIGESLGDKVQFNVRRRPDWNYYRSFHSGFSLVESPSIARYVAERASLDHGQQVIPGINGKLFVTTRAKNFVSRRTLSRVSRVLKALGLPAGRQIAIIPIENYCIVTSGSLVIWLRNDCSRTRFDEERERIRVRHVSENQILFPAVRFIWNDQIDDDRFELLVRDLLSRKKEVIWIRKVSKSRERDHGRDLIADRITEPDACEVSDQCAPAKSIRTVIQCKTSRRTIGKSQVMDIRDTMEFHEATGYFLAVSTYLRTNLTDFLDKLRKTSGYWIDWWTRSEIEDELNAHPDIVMKYPDIITPC